MRRRDSNTEELTFDGKQYITAARAAELVRYTKDYVGQLARAGKLDARLVGRSWYIAIQSIKEHKETTNYVLTKPKKPRKYDRGMVAKDSDVEDVDNVHIVKSESSDVINAPLPNTVTNIDMVAAKGFVREENKSDFGFVEESPTSLDDDDEHVQSVPVRNKTTASRRVDPLVHTSIRYEQGERLEYEDSQFASKRNQELRYEGVPISRRTVVHTRTPTNVPGVQRFASFQQHERVGQLVSTDGIVARSRKNDVHTVRTVKTGLAEDAARSYQTYDKRARTQPPLLIRLALFFGAFILCLGVVLLALYLITP